jgi:PAS domain S-box-containing protein
LRDKSGRAVRMAGVNIDITDRKQAEDERRRREIEFETLAENCPSIISRFDLNHRHLYVNRSIEPITGLSRAAFIGRTNRELGMPPEMCTFWEEKLESVVRTRRELTFEFSFAGPSGTYHFESKVVPEFGPDGQVVSVLCLASDISDRRQLQAQILSIAEREQRRIGQDLHDDVGQELTGLGLMSEALCDALEGRDERLALLATRVRSRLSHVQRRVRLISGLLVPVELDRGGLMVALEELCRRITGSTSDLRASFQCEDQVQVADNRVATQLYRIAQEAMANAIKHGDARYVAVSLRRRGGLVILEIRDDGKGLMADSPKSGMGIEIMRYRAGLINGSLDIGTAEAGGTKVVCILAEEER